MSTVCSQCGGSDIEYDQSRGDAVCTGCGCVLEDNIIVSEVTFAEQSSGASSVIGQFVSSEGSKIPLSGSGFHHGMGKNSREITIRQAKKRLSNLGHLLKLNQHCIDSAVMFFKMALQMNLTRGRKSSIIDTACLYLVCRSEGTPHLLLDFSDVLQINVYSLGRAYLRLANALHIHPPAIDPCLYIHRFAHKLELGSKTHDVSMTALRAVARMKRDWIHHGRRPAGLCGAALLVSARLHNFSRSVKEVSRVVKVSEGTLRKRLGDFKDTASSRLTIEEFLKIDLEQEHDPPSYVEAKKKAKLKMDKSLGKKVPGGPDSSDEDEEDSDDEEEGKRGFSGIKNQSVDEIIAKARFTESFLAGSASIGLTNNLEELAKLGDVEGPECDLNLEERGVLCTDDLDEEELDGMLLSEEEVKIKSQLWFAENAEFLKERELKREKMALEKAEKEKNRKGRARTKKPKAPHFQQTYSNAGEAIGKMLVERRISTKINYDVLRDIDIDSGSLGSRTSSMNTQESADSAENATAACTTVSGGRQSEIPPVSNTLTITRTPVRNRLPSLSSRKRNFSSFGSLSSHPLSISHAAASSPNERTSMIDNPRSKRTKLDQPRSVMANLDTMESILSDKLKDLEHQRNVDGGGSCDPIGGSCDPNVVEETGPVEYCDDEEEEVGLDDDEMEALVYEDDPLLAHSDCEEGYDEF